MAFFSTYTYIFYDQVKGGEKKMTIQKNLNTSTLVIEVGDKTDDSGNTKYSNKNFNNINRSATPENIHWDTAYLEGDFVKSNKNNNV